MDSKYDNMHTNEIFNALNCINNLVNLCINCILSVWPMDLPIDEINSDDGIWRDESLQLGHNR